MQSNRIKPRFQPPTNWQAELFQSNPIFADLQQLFQPSRCRDWPTPDWLNQQRTDTSYEFVANALLERDGRYYEDYIYASQQIPTRAENWHDFFGGLIWCLFPRTKALLNQLHIQEIERAGHSPRTPLRNKITLLDECGVLIAYTPAQRSLVQQLQQHQWTDVFWQRRALWWQQVRPVVFGHAIYEMATQPFIGLTAKCWFIEVPDDFCGSPLISQYAHLDAELSQCIGKQPECLLQKTQLTPLPLLGVPGWYADNQQLSFYQNLDYFRPKRNR
ncbi:DUF3025 domain-containing protein [Alkalimonas delamerensis]|uniref:DUF3025 domain-containing protein n=1 Tax=Alkalimonas delamerensis TaxID=265981 RepID=A0ABT9GR01_9GAMM|nr:DUF3025 domain-containing protein [Alkalimonas delamerensis]MDP4529398.1 DUF3025 domain-containing protein [Alkalimonas delamerensis]